MNEDALNGLVPVTRAEPEWTDAGVERGFFGPGRRLFGCFHAARVRASPRVAVICAPLGYEGIQTDRSMRVLASALAGGGLACLRFDYDGTGESLGYDEDPGRVRAWIESVEVACECARRRSGVEEVYLVGVRAGALLASQADIEVCEAVWVEPCLSGRHFVRELEVMASAQRARLAESVGVAVTDGVGGDSFAGYAMTAETRADLEALSLRAPRLGEDGRLFVYSRRASPAVDRFVERSAVPPTRVQFETVPEMASMFRDPAVGRTPEALVRRIVLAATPPPARVGDRLSSEGEPFSDASGEEGTTRTVTTVGARRVFGVATGSLDRAPRRVVFVAGGRVPRTAVNRLYVYAADRLAAHGVASLRIDVGGVGESPAMPGSPPSTAFGRHVVDDVLAAVKHVARGHGEGGVTVVGLCSGAYAAFQAAKACDAIDHVILINPWLLLAKEWELFFGYAADHDDRPRLPMGVRSGVRALGDRSIAWHALLAGWRYRAGRLAEPFLNRTLAAVGARPLGLGGALRRVGERCHLGLALSPGDDGVRAVLERANPEIERLVARGSADLCVFAGADHTFSPIPARDALVEWLVGGIRQRDSAAESGGRPA